MDAATAAQLIDLARDVGRLSPDWGDPRRFYKRRDDLADALVTLAQGGTPDSGGRR